MLPSERGNVGQQIVRNHRSLRAQLPNGTVEIDRVPVDNGGGDEAQARRAEALVFEGAVSNFSRRWKNTARRSVGGRRKKLDPGKRKEIAESVISGRKTGAEIARLYSISAPTVSRIVAQHRPGPA